jgi:3-hydroxyisobutyrate dehydrogenase
MGGNMARRLAEVGERVVAVCDRVTSRAKQLAQELNCEAPRSLAKVTALADVILTVVTDDAAMDSIFPKNRGGLLTHAGGRLFINCATVSPECHARVEERATQVGAETLEACMASSVEHARRGALYLMCGGRRETFERALPLLKKLGREVRYIGETGEAARMKLIVNLVMNANTAALAEGMGLADALGMDLSLVREVLDKTGAASRVLETDGEDMEKREYQCYFSAAHATKDINLAVRMARRCRLELPIASAAKRQYIRLLKTGLGDLDKSAISELTFRERGFITRRRAERHAS